jgi:hypothetical protein
MTERQQLIQGLREMADYLAGHEAVPITKHQMNEFVDTREEWDAIRATDPELAARASGQFFVLRKVFTGGVSLEINAERPMAGLDADEAPDIPM